MAAQIPPAQRQYLGPYLSDIPHLTVIVVCCRCHIHFRWSGARLLERIDEDCNLPTLIGKLAIALKCPRAIAWKNYFDPQCQLAYESALMDEANAGIRFRVGVADADR
jgi:hypothetical protein